jgi:two-component system OmpR family response regulator
MRMLLVSRQHRESEWLSKALRESAHSVRCFNDLRDGILAAPKESFDAIFLMLLEPSSYPELTTALRQFAAAANRAVIMVVLGLATTRERIEKATQRLFQHYRPAAVFRGRELLRSGISGAVCTFAL